MKILGLMSGTSLDGLDLTYVEFDDQNFKKYRIIHAETYPYRPEWKKKLQDAYNYKGENLIKLHVDYGIYLGKKVLEFINENKLPRPDYIASHGQTVYHRPEESYTFQLGSGAHIAATAGIDTVCDFRIQDVALGGQGAPLVPIGDKLLFEDYTYCLNIGGFANVSYDNHKEERIAFDVCPANIVLNFYAQKQGLEFDRDGELAGKGKIHTDLLNELENWPYYQKQPPKSLGWEDVTEEIIPKLEKFNLPAEDILATFTEHIALQIGKVARKGKMLVTGGGALNKFLVEKIRNHAQAEIVIPSNKLVMFKEALIFALLGYLKVTNRINVLKSVTGARKDHIAGVVYPA